MKIVLTIAGSDPSGGAGIQADLKAFAAMRVYGLSVVTAVTAQNTVAVTGIHAIPPEFVGKQIDTVLEDISVDAVKTGMLANVSNIETVCDRLQRFSVPNIVVDPVMVATSGDFLMSEHIERVLWAFRQILIPSAKVVTPNIPEAEILTGRDIRGIADMKAAAADLYSMGVPYVVIKGGHLSEDEDAVDLLFNGEDFLEFREARIVTANTHGTGCTFASALAAGLAGGRTVPEAVREAKSFVRKALKEGFAVGRGRGTTNHFGELYRLADSVRQNR